MGGFMGGNGPNMDQPLPMAPMNGPHSMPPTSGASEGFPPGEFNNGDGNNDGANNKANGNGNGSSESGSVAPPRPSPSGGDGDFPPNSSKLIKFVVMPA